MTRTQLAPWQATRVLQTLEGGFRNEVYLVERDGAKLVAKTTRRSPAAIVWLNEVLDCAEAAGFVVPRFIASDDGRFQVGGLTLETYLVGKPLAKQDLPILAQQLHSFHQLTKHIAQRPGFLAAVDLLEQVSGGDVDLSRMPVDLVIACRKAWRVLLGLPQAVVHGDLTTNNVLQLPDGRYGLLDWDEARVDASVFDSYAVGIEVSAALQRAALAWEIAVCWHIEPEYASKMARILTGNS